MLLLLLLMMMNIFCGLQALFLWDRLGYPKIKADGTSEADFVPGLSDLVGRGEGELYGVLMAGGLVVGGSEAWCGMWWEVCGVLHLFGRLKTQELGNK